MKIITVINNFCDAGDAPRWYCKADTSLLRNNDAFYIPDSMGRIAAEPQIVIRISRLANRETKPLKVLHHLDSAPPVECDLFDMKFLSEIINEIFDKAIMDHVPLRSLQKSLPLPYVIRNMVTPHTQAHIFFRYPEVRK